MPGTKEPTLADSDAASEASQTDETPTHSYSKV